MNDDTIVQEVRDIRAAIAAEFGYDRTKLIAWAREQTKQRKALGSANSSKTLEIADGHSKPPAARARRSRPARVSA